MSGKSVLAIGAHPDDIELGCGGTIARHVAAGDQVTMLVITKGEVGPGDTPRREAEQIRSCAALGVTNLLWGVGIGDCEVSLHELELVHLIEKTLTDTHATIVYTHSHNDSHQDHRAVGLCTMGAARKISSVLAYGAPSVVEFNPTVFMDITETLETKIESLLCHATQVQASEMVQPSRVRSSAEHYGHSCRSPYAEGFEPVRYVMEVC